VSGLTHGEAIRIAAEKFRDAGLEDPRFEARQIVLWATGLTSAALISAHDEPMAFEHQSAWQMAVRHREARRPFQHLAGWTDFYGLSLKTDPRALIPRADSECVVDLALELLPKDREQQIADLGTGSGCLLLAGLSQRPMATGFGLDASQEAVRLARDNADTIGLGDRTAFECVSWTEWTGWATCDLIISNPPYIASGIIPTLDPEVRDHDPVMALDGGEDGLSAYREIIALAGDHMTSGAHIVLEIGYDQRETVTKLLATAGFEQIRYQKDLGGNDRAIAATRPWRPT